MKRAILIAAALLTSCNDAPDGYRFGKPEYIRESMTLNVVQHSSHAELRGAALAAGADAGNDRELMAFSVITARGSTCTIHIVDPAVSYQPQWIGHEVAHCIYGRWHP
ncbi:hypothetical protein KFK14_12965 [Sphingobium phenoxybenzoativorans]|uniref:Lipoprotein n=1 Tax=Sphingobium phenoxybenzoativorans TaxID=1592790 RepID=A0A975K365_9SPHN|nr:hypothetical protein [Sphingobium phenoxybenzoativorans]QUT04058.1 hypothetical protein KFK14_12965 [Sphingobium phenoxybenzoativorans]